VTRVRDLVWDGCQNVRDLGGHPTEDGRETRFGRVVRADLIRRLSDDGWATLTEYGVRTIVDLRHEEELEADPPHELPVAVEHVPLFPDPASARWPEIEALGRRAGPGAPWIRVVYGELLARFPERMAAAVSAVARAPDAGVVVHCMAGKDRTGLVTAVLLSLAGVPREEIGTDYAVTEANLAEDIAQWIDEAETDEDRDWRRRIGVAPAEAMVGVLDDLEAKHGAVETYLLAGGSSADDLVAVRSRLLD
jgi:protein tyrosine/serine phosphatase